MLRIPLNLAVHFSFGSFALASAVNTFAFPEPQMQKNLVIENRMKRSLQVAPIDVASVRAVKMYRREIGTRVLYLKKHTQESAIISLERENLPEQETS